MKKKIPEGFRGEKAIVIPDHVIRFQCDNPITKQLFITRIGFYPRAKHHYRERPEGCSENIFIYCKDGKGWIKHKDTVYNLNRNQTFIIPSRQTHAYGADDSDPWSIYWFHFCGENISMFSSIMGTPIHVEESDRSRYDDRLQLFDEMYHILETGYKPENMEYVSYCLMYFLASLKYINQFREIKKSKQTDVIHNSILFMKDNLANNISLEDIAHQAGYSTSYFCDFFAKKTMYAPMVYYNQLKIQYACTYLQISDMKIKEIAYLLGFYDPFHFSKSFKQKMGLSPKEYRKNMQRQFE